MKRIFIIINPGAGADYPILSLLHRKLQNKRLQKEILVAHRKGDIGNYTKKAIKEGVSAVAVYGGDGSIIEAAKILYKTNIPLIILPGGTANILAKELNIPIIIENVVDLLFSNKAKIKKFDVGLCNRTPFFLRVSTGLMADMVINANPTLKKSLGQLAYPITAVQTLTQTEEIEYTLHIDGQKIIETGMSLVVANSGNIGFPGISMLSDVSITDGKLDIVLIKKTISTTQTITRWQGKKIIVSQTEAKHQTLCDDSILDRTNLAFTISPHQLHVMIP